MSEITGKIKVINAEQQVSAAFKKRELVVTTEETFPQHILIEFQQDKCDLLNNYKVGQEVKVSVNIRGRIWTNPQGEDKYFNSIQGWRIESLTNAKETINTTNQSFEPAPSFEDDGSGLPF